MADTQFTDDELQIIAGVLGDHGKYSDCLEDAWDDSDEELEAQKTRKARYRAIAEKATGLRAQHIAAATTRIE